MRISDWSSDVCSSDLRHAACRKLEPIMMEGDARDLFAEGTERMDIAFADAPEIVEIDAQLIGRVRGAHEGGLVDTEPLDEAADVRQGDRKSTRLNSSP